jgi:hypothetical protein
MSFVPFQGLRSGENLIQVSTKPAVGHFLRSVAEAALQMLT